MHSTAYDEVAEFAKTLPKDKSLKIADVGAYDVNGTLKPIFNVKPWEYTGIDIAAGPNVDVVIPPDGRWVNILDATYDVVVSVSTLEHARRPWVMVMEMGRILKRGGLTCIAAPYMWPEHQHPIDCWRILPEGMKTILKDAGFVVLSIKTKPFPAHPHCADTIAIARKP
jgi:SAM-dependent methyltransferase